MYHTTIRATTLEGLVEDLQHLEGTPRVVYIEKRKYPMSDGSGEYTKIEYIALLEVTEEEPNGA